MSAADEWFGRAWHEQLDNLLNTIRFVTGGPMIFAVPDRINPELLRKMLAAVLAHHGGYSSIDYVLKRYAKQWDIEPQADDDHLAVSRMLAAVLQEVHSVIASWSKVPDKPGALGRVAAGAALMRSETSFKSAALLIRVGHVYEAYAIARMILEQTAWAYSVRDLPDEEVVQTSPTKAIGSLRHWIPEAGRLYGWLSDRTHIPFDVSREFVDTSNGDFEVVLRSHKAAPLAAWILLIVGDIYSLVSEYVYRDSLASFRHIVLNRDQPERFPGRPLFALIEEFRNR